MSGGSALLKTIMSLAVCVCTEHRHLHRGWRGGSPVHEEEEKLFFSKTEVDNARIYLLDSHVFSADVNLRNRMLLSRVLDELTILHQHSIFLAVCARCICCVPGVRISKLSESFSLKSPERVLREDTVPAPVCTRYILGVLI